MIWDILWVIVVVVLVFVGLFLIFTLVLGYQVIKRFNHKAQRVAYLAGKSPYNPIFSEPTYNPPPTWKKRLIGYLKARLGTWFTSSSGSSS